MTSEQLVAFLAVVDTRSFSEAAVRLYTTQPTISRQIRALEDELKVELLTRQHKRVELTPAGRQVYEFALTQQAQETSLLQSLSLFQGRAGTIRLALTPICCTPFLHRSISRFQSLHPELAFSLQEVAAEEAANLLDSNGCELVAGRRDQMLLLCDCLDLYDDHLVLVLPKQHPLAGSESVSLRRLEGEPFLLLSNAASTHQTILNLCKQEGFLPNIRFSGTQLMSILELVRQGLGITIMAKRSVPTVYYDALSLVALSQLEEQSFTISLMRKRSRPLTPQTAEFWAYMGR